MHETFVNAPVLPQAISGLPGGGKTEIALEYAYCFQEQYDAVLWASAESSEILTNDLLALAPFLDLPRDTDVERALVSLRTWFAKHTNWLLVADNLTDFSHLNAVLPIQHRGHVLITTTLRAAGARARLVPIDDLTAEESIRLLLIRAGLHHRDQLRAHAMPEDRAIAAAICRELNYLPLAVDQAGAYIEETPSSLGEYLELYKESQKALLDYRGENATRHTSVTKTFRIAFSRLNDPSAAELIRACAFLAPDSIPENLVRGDLTPALFAVAIREATRFSLIRRNPREKTFTIHRRVQQVLRDGMATESIHAWVNRSSSSIGQCLRSAPSPADAALLITHALSVSDLALRYDVKSPELARMHRGAGGLLKQFGQYAPAMGLLQREYRLAVEVFGTDHPLTGTALGELGEVAWRLHQKEVARKALEDAVGILESAGAFSASLAKSLLCLSDIYRNDLEFAKAEETLRRLIRFGEAHSGQEGADIVAFKARLVSLYAFVGKAREAESLVNELADSLEHSDSAFVLDEISHYYSRAGRFRECVALRRRAVDLQKTNLGPDHPELAINLANLASALNYVQEFGEALHVVDEAIAIIAGYAEDSVMHANALMTKALIYGNQSKYRQEEQILGKVVGIYKNSLEPNHPSLATALYLLGECLGFQDRLDAAEDCLLSAIEKFCAAFGEKHDQTARAYMSLCATYVRGGKQLPALDAVSHALHIRRELYPDDHALVVEAKEVLHLLEAAEQRDSGSTINSAKRPGRNEACPCGSGKKYKRCHGR